MGVYSNVFVKYVFYFMNEVDNIYISWVIIIVHFSSEIKDIFNKKTFGFSFYYIQRDRFLVLYDVIHVRTFRHISDDFA